jgi:uncharacterized protein YjbI with pentapeptide repeats
MAEPQSEPSDQDPEAPPLRELSEDEFEEIVREHALWVHSRKKKGSPAVLHGTSLRWRSLRGLLLPGADLEGADFEGADLEGADLQGADLKRATFRGANLKDTCLWDADLREADLREAVGLLPAQFGGADACRALLPPALLPLEQHTNLTEASQTADKLGVSLLVGCAYAALTLAGTTDAGLLGDLTTTKLPLLGTDIRIVGFFAIAPMLLCGFSIYINLYLRFVWEGLAALPAIFPDGTPIHKKTYPWMLTGLPRAYWLRLRSERTLHSRIQLWFTQTMAWWLVPLTLEVFWWRFLSRLEWLPQPWPWPALRNCWIPYSLDGLMVAWHFALLLVSIWSGLSFSRLARATFCRETEELARWKVFSLEGWLSRARFLLAVALVGLLLWVSPWEMRHREADMGGGNLDGSELPGVQLQKADLEGVQLRAAHLEKAQFQGAHLEGARLQGAHLEGAQFQHAYLQEAQLDGAHLGWVNLSYAHLEQASLPNADLNSADLHAAFLESAQLQGTHFWSADLRQADLRQANLEKGAVLQSALLEQAQLQGAHLGEANLQRAHMEGALLQGAHLDNANLRKAILDGAQFQGARLSDAILRGAHLESAQFPSAHLNGTQFQNADLQKSNFRMADLRGADFEGADLRGANFRSVHLLGGANFESADLRGASFRGAELHGARYNPDTRWPAGVDPRRQGAVLVH